MFKPTFADFWDPRVWIARCYGIQHRRSDQPAESTRTSITQRTNQVTGNSRFLSSSCRNSWTRMLHRGSRFLRYAYKIGVYAGHNIFWFRSNAHARLSIRRSLDDHGNCLRSHFTLVTFFAWTHYTSPGQYLPGSLS